MQAWLQPQKTHLDSCPDGRSGYMQNVRLFPKQSSPWHVPGLFFLYRHGGEPMFSCTITHFWGTANHPSARYLSNEVMVIATGILRGLCHCSCCKAAREKSLSLFFTTVYQYALFSNPGSIWIGSSRGMSGFCHIYTLLWLYIKWKHFVGNLT